VADIQKLRELGELKEAGILTQEEFDKEKHKILNNDFSSPSPSTPSSIIGENVFNPDGTSADSASQKELGLNSPGFFSKLDTSDFWSKENSNMRWLIGGIILVIFLIFALSLGSSSTATVSYSGCWSGAFSDGSMNIVSIDGCGNESFDCGSGGYCGINAQKQDDSTGRLCVSVGSNQACTTAAYGVASV